MDIWNDLEAIYGHSVFIQYCTVPSGGLKSCVEGSDADTTMKDGKIIEHGQEKTFQPIIPSSEHIWLLDIGEGLRTYRHVIALGQSPMLGH